MNPKTLSGYQAPTFTVSPWDMLKSLPWKSRFKLFYYALRIGRDPERTEEIFNIAGLFLNAEVKGKNGLADYMQSLYDIPGIRALYNERYLPPPGNVDELLKLPEGTLGHAFAKHMKANNLSVGFYPAIDAVDETTYLELRARQTHDVLHVVTGFGTAVSDELGLQAFGVAQVNSPLSGGIIGGGIIHACLFKPWILHECVTKVANGFIQGKAARHVLAYKFEDNWAKPLAEVRQELGIAV